MLPVSDIAIETIHVFCSSRKQEKSYLSDIIVSSDRINEQFRSYIRHLVRQRPNVKSCKPLTFVLHGLSNTAKDLETLNEICSLVDSSYVRIEDSCLVMPELVNRLNAAYVLETDCSTKYGLERISSNYNQYKNLIVHCTINDVNQDYYKAKEYIESYVSNARIEFSFCKNSRYLPDDCSEYSESIRRVCSTAANAFASGLSLPFEESIVLPVLSRHSCICRNQSYDLYPLCSIFSRSVSIDLAGNFYLCSKIPQKFTPASTSYEFNTGAITQILNEVYKTKEDCASCDVLHLCRGGCPFSLDKKLCKLLKVYYSSILSIYDQVSNQRTEIEL